MAHATNNGMSANSEHELDTPAVSPGAYAPSPNTSSQALSRANQLRVQNLLRRLLLEPEESIRIDTLRVLRKTLREIDFRLSWLTQVDFLETMERVLRNETQGLAKAGGENQDQEQQQQQQHNGLDTSWRLLHDATQLLIESLSRFEHELERQTVESIVPSVVENLGHSRSEVRRASLLLLNQMLNERPQHFELIVRLFVDYGLTNHRNKQAQRGSILSLPLLINETIVERGEDLTPVVRCLSELLMIDSNEQLFYSLFLAMQRIHMMIGDGQFQAILRRHCEPEAAHLYRQAVSRSNSLVAPSESLSRPETDGAQRDSSARKDSQQQLHATSKQHVTFEASADAGEEEQAPGGVEAEPKLRDLKQSQQEAEQLREGRLRSDSQLSTATTASELTSESCSAALNPEGKELHGQEQQQEEDENPLDHHPAVFQGRKFSSDVSSTCSSDAHLVNPAHYMTKAALSGHPLDHYEEIHHIDHSNINGLAINDFGPICNTPTIELFQSQLPSSIHFRPGASTDTPAANLLLLSSSSELKFGIFPKQLIQVTLQSPRPSDRYEAMQELMCIVRESPVNHLAILMTYFDSFLEQFLAKVLLPHHQAGASSKQPTSLHQSDCKLELIAIDMIETIIVKTKVSTMQYIRPIVGLLMRALVLDSQRQPGGRSAGPVQPHAPDPSSSSLTSSAGQHQQQLAALSSAPGIFRENACRVIHKMMAYLPPQHVIDAIFEHKHQRAAVVREEAINRVTAAILEYDRNEFNLTKLCYHVLPMLADHSATVRLASLECIATLAHVLGPERIGSLLTAAEAVQTGCDYDGLLDAINARLLRHTLPRCQSNGIVRYALKPLLLSHQHLGSQTELAADVRWVLESPSLHQHSHTGHTMKDGCDEHHHHHRLGVYSPPSQAERRRRSSVGLALLEHPEELRQQQQRAVGGHQHHHSLRRHRSTSVINQQQQEQDEDDPKAHHQAKQGDMSSSNRRASKATTRRTSSDGQQEVRETAEGAERKHRRSQNGHSTSKTTTHRQHQEPPSSGCTSCSRRRSSLISESKPKQQQPRQHQKRPSQVQQSLKRSNSQDSLSSTDTNKVLFQYYLGKFKQSLAESPGNQYQADSIIYTSDVGQAYELSRHQSRFQQTSFENENESVGRAPGGTNSMVAPTDVSLAEDKTIEGAAPRKKSITATTMSQAQDQRQRQQSFSQAKFKSKRSQSPKDSPTRLVSSNQQDQEEATSDSESPQTVLEQAPNRRRPALGSGTKTVHRQSVQRQATVESCPVAHEPEPGGETYTRKSSAGAALGAGDVRRQSVAPASGRRQSDEQAASEEEHGCETSPEQTSESHGQQQFKTLRQRSQSVSKQSSSSAEQQHATSMNLQQRHNRDSQQTLEGTSESRASLQRQESSSTNASSLATTASSGYFMAAASDGEAGEPVADQQDDEEEAQPRRRSSSQQRSRAKSRPRHSAANQHEQDYDKDVTTINKPNSHQDTPLARRRSSRSQPPVARREAAARNNSNHQTAILIHVRHQSNYQNNHELDPKRACSVSPSLAQSVNIRHVLENVAQVDGPFAEPQLALKVAMDALESPCWSTKVEGLLALVRLVAHHPGQVLAEPGRLHEIVTRTVDETRNLRSTVARSAIFALGDFCARLKRSVEPEMEQIVQALLSRASENTTFIRDDIRRALSELVEHLTPWRLANLLIAHGAQHKSAHVRRMTSQFVAKVVLDRLGPAKALVGAREISQALLPAVARFAQDQSPHTRYYGRLILSKLMQHSSFERLTRRHLSSTLYRSTLGILESIKRRGVGALPDD